MLTSVKHISGQTVPIEQIRSRLRPLLVESGLLVKTGGTYRFDVENAGAIGFDVGGTNFQTEDQAVDAILAHWFPNAYQKAA